VLGAPRPTRLPNGRRDKREIGLRRMSRFYQAGAMNRRPWHWAAEELLRWHVRQGRSYREAARLMGKRAPEVCYRLRRLGIRSCALPGAPRGNRNGEATRFRPGNYPRRWLRKKAA
jgi:hypothetical protein